MRSLLVGLVLIVSACSSGPSAPAIVRTAEVCNPVFCVDAPEGWVPEIGDTYVSFHHELSPEHTYLTVGLVDMEAIVVNAGGSWPVPTEEVARAFWSLLETANVGEFERSTRLFGGSIKTWGTHIDGDMWHLLSPIEASRGVAIEVRAPNRSWETHADVVFGSLRVLED